MVDTKRIRGIIEDRRLTYRKTAELIGVHERTLHSKLQSGDFHAWEMSALIKALDIKDPVPVFFAELRRKK